jgi:hypothetical protein
VHRVDGTAGSIGRDRRKQRGVGDAEANFLAFHVADGRIDAQCSKRGIALRLGPVRHCHTGKEEEAHNREDCPALTLIADHSAEDIGQRRADREDQDQLD